MEDEYIKNPYDSVVNLNDEEILVKVYEYEFECFKDLPPERKITNDEVKIVLHEILENNNIRYKNKLTEKWFGLKRATYHLFVEIYVYQEDEQKALKLIEELECQRKWPLWVNKEIEE